MSSFIALTKVHWKSLSRDRQAMFWFVAFPLMFLLLFGTLMRDNQSSRSSVELVGDVPMVTQLPPEVKSAWDSLFVTTYSTDAASTLAKVRKGSIDGMLQQQDGKLILSFSRADAAKAAMVQGALNSFVQHTNVALSGKPPTFELRTNPVEDESLKAIQFLAPGLLGWGVAMASTFSAAMGLVQWRTTKLLRRLRLAPVRTRTLVSSHILISLAVAGIQTVVFLAVAMGLFGLRLTGSWPLAIPLIILATLAFMAIGLFVGAVSKSVDSANGLANAIILPMAFLSGSFFPLENAPAWLKTVANFLPLGHLNDGMLNVMVRGQGLSSVLLNLGVLATFTVVVGLIAVRCFRWEN